MSEKRLASSGDSFVDLTQMETVDLLNKLSDENTKLHKKVDEQQSTIQSLKEENEKLTKMLNVNYKTNNELVQYIQMLESDNDE